MKHRKQESETEKQTRRRLANRESARRMRMRRVEALIVLQQQVASLTQQNLRAVAGNVKLVEKLNAMAAALQMMKDENAQLQAHLRRVYQMSYGQDFPSTMLESSPMMPPSLDTSIASTMSNNLSFNTQVSGQHQAPQPSFPTSISPSPELMMSMSQSAEGISQSMTQPPSISPPDFRALFSSLSGLDSMMPTSSLADSNLAAQLNLDRTFGLDLCSTSQGASASAGDHMLDFSPAALAAAAAAVVAASGAPHTSPPTF